MFAVEIDYTDLDATHRELQEIRRGLTRNLTSTVREAVSEIKGRISLGKNASGHFMVTRSPRRRGRYSPRHGLRRSLKGLRIDIVNLQFTGRTFRSFKVLATHRSALTGLYAEIEIGFDDARAIELAARNDEHFGGAYAIKIQEADHAFGRYLKSFDTPLLDGLL